jgi:hypothetical protein
MIQDRAKRAPQDRAKRAPQDRAKRAPQDRAKRADPEGRTDDDVENGSFSDIFRSPTTRRLIRAYGPVLLVALAFLLMAVIIPTMDRTVTP